MGLFSNNQFADGKAIKRQMKLDQMPEPLRQRIHAADRAASALEERIDKLTTARRDGTKPIESADVAELDAIASQADALVEGLSLPDTSVVDDIWQVHYRAHMAVNAERNRRYNALANERVRIGNMRSDFTYPLTIIAQRLDGFTKAMDELDPDTLLGPLPAPVDVTEPDAAAMTDGELDAAISDAYRLAHDGIGVSYYADEVERMAELLPKAARMMHDYREKAMAQIQRAEDSHRILAAEKQRRREQAGGAAATSSRPMAERIAEMERMLDEIRKGA